LLAAACQPLPRPFMPEEGTIRGPKTLAPLVDGGGIVVNRVANVPPAVSDAVQRAMIDALAVQNIPAAAGGANVLSRFLTGTAKAPPDAGSRPRIDVEIVWALTDRAGRKLGERTTRMSVPRATWLRPSRRTLAPLAAPAAPALAALLQEPVEKAARKPNDVPLHVWPVAGVAGDGPAALRLAMEAALGRRGYRVTPDLAENGLVIAGSVSLGAEDKGQLPITVEWAVLDGGGASLGKLDQRNAVPAAALARGWGELAPLIAEAAAGGIGTLLNRLPPGAGARPAGG
jgi:hypothetical protein